ncbi:hypothetical protein JXA85_00890, partial [Candidatus Woesearchaeota archaeon]|nr:hypothetical protein [Candidatus Woesearchaeota archaeon]
SVFNSDLSPLESLVLYLHEQGELRLSEVARRLNRDQRTIWITLRNAKLKKVKLDLKSKVYLPIRILSDRRLSILEHICVQLKEKNGLRFNEIALLLNKAPNTIWTCYTRGIRKGGDSVV